MPAVILDPLPVAGFQFTVHDLGGDGKGRQGIGAHAMDHDPAAGPDPDRVAFAPPEHVFHRSRGGQKEIDIFAILVLGYKKMPIIGMVRQDIIHGCRSDNGAYRGVGADILHLFSQTPDFPSIIQTLKILLDCFNHLCLSFL